MNKIFQKINIDYILKNYFYLIVLLLIPLILVTGLLYLIIPNYESMRVEVSTAIDLENKYSELKISHIKKLKEYKNTFENVDDKYLEKVKKILPYNRDISAILNELSQITKKVGVDIEKISFQEEKDSKDPLGLDQNKEPNNGMKKISFSVNIKNGKDYKTFKSLLSELESNVRLFDINNFYVASDFQKYSFNITCYYKEI